MDYSAIVGRLAEYLDAKNDTKLAQKLGLGSGTAVANWRTRETLDIKRVLAAAPNIDLNWLLRGEEPEKLAAHLPLIPQEAVAGYGAESFSDLCVEDYYRVPDFKNADFLIRVTGDSMTPKYKSGDIVACRRIERVNFWQWHSVYVVATQNQGVLIKRVEPGISSDFITCVSENPVYRPFQIPKEEVVSVALVLGSIVLE